MSSSKSLQLIAALMTVVFLTSPVAWAKKNKCDSQKGGKKSLGESAEYCLASEAANKAAKNQQLLMAIHAGAAGVCVVGCAAAMTGYGASWGIPACMGASLGAGVADIVTTQQFTGAASALVGGYGLIRHFGVASKLGPAFQAGAGGATPALAKNAKEGSKTSAALCFLTVAIEGAMAVMNGMGAQKSKKAADENQKHAEEIIQTGTPAIPTAVAASPGQFAVSASGDQGSSSQKNPSSVSESPTVVTGQNSSADTAKAASSSTLLTKLDSCTDGSFASRLECAKASGFALPAAAMTPDFIPTLEQLSGKRIDDLMNQGDPQSIVSSVVGNHLGPDYAQTVQGAMAQMEEAVLSASNSSVSYAAKTGGTESSAQADLQSSMQSLLGSLQGASPEDNSEGTQEKFQKKTGLSASIDIENNPSISLFDRISQRYRASENRVATRGYASPQNKMLSH